MSCLTDTDLAALEAGTLEGPADGTAREHLRGCERCFARREDLVGTVRLLGAIDAAEIAPPPACWTAVEARIAGRAAPQTAIAIACAYCKGKLARTGAVYCAGCIAPHHEDCWEEHGRCAACAARDFVKAAISVRPARPRRRGWIIATAGLLVGAGAAGAALERRMAAAPQSAAVTPPPPGADTTEADTTRADTTRADTTTAPLASWSGRARGRVALDDANRAIELSLQPLSIEEIRAAFARSEASVAVLDLAELVKHGVASVDSKSSAEEVELLARASLELVRREEQDAVAIQGYKRALALAPGSVTAHLARARMAARRKDHKLAQEEYAKVVALAPTEIGLAIERARSLAHAGDLAGARAMVDRLAAEPLPDGASGRARVGRANLLAYRAQLRRASGEPEGALDDLRAAAALAPDDAATAEVYVGALAEARLFEEGLAHLDALLGRDPRRPEIWLLRGQLRERLLDYEGALQDLTRAIELDPRAGGFKERARILILMSDTRDLADEVESQAGKVVTLGDLTAEVAARRSRRMREASQNLASAGRSDPIEDARIELAMGHREQAIARLDPQNDGTSAQAAALRGFADLGLSDPSSGRGYFETALAAGTDLPLALAGLATTYLKEGDNPRARSLFKKARDAESRSTDPEEAYYFARGLEHAHRARLGLREQDRVLARRAFARVTFRHPLNARAYLERAKLARAFQQWDLAVEEATAATRVDPCCVEAFLFLARLREIDLPVAPDAASARPVNVHDKDRGRTLIERARDVADGEDVADALGLGYLLDERAYYREASVGTLHAEESRAVAAVASSVADAPVERLARALRLAMAGACFVKEGETGREERHAARKALVAACAERVRAEVARARVLLDEAHDPWSALDALDRASVLASALPGTPDAAIAELQARGRAALGPPR